MSVRALIGPSAASIGLKIFGMLLGMVTAMVLGRHLGPAGYGHYVFVLAFATTASIPIRLGFPKLILRETAKNLKAGDIPKMYSVWRWAHIFIIGGIAVFSAVAMLVMPYVNIDDFVLEGLIAGAILIPLLSLMELRAAILHGLGRIMLAQIPDLVVRPALLLTVAAYLIFVADVNLAPNDALKIQVFSVFIAFVFGALMLLRYRPPLTSKRARLKNLRGLIWSAILLGSVSGLQTLNASLDSLMLRALVSDSAVGIYKVASLFSSLVPFGLQAIIVVISPRIAHYGQDKELAKLQNLAVASTKLIFAAAFVPALIFFLFGREILVAMFGESFEIAHSALMVLTIGQLVSAFFGPVGAILSMTGNEKIAFRGVLFAAGSNVILNFSLIPSFGLLGAAIATATTMAFWNLLLWLEVRRRLNVNTLGNWYIR